MNETNNMQSVMAKFPDEISLYFDELKPWSVSGINSNRNRMLNWDHIKYWFPGLNDVSSLEADIMIRTGEVINMRLRIRCHTKPEEGWWLNDSGPYFSFMDMGKEVGANGIIAYVIEVTAPLSSFSASWAVDGENHE